MAEEEVIAIPVQPSDHKRKLENLESEILEQQHAGSIDNDVSVDDDKNASDYCQPKRLKLDDEAVDGLGIGGTVENSGDVESKEEGTEKPIAQSDENQDGNPLIEKVQETIDAEESDNKMEDNGKPEDNQLVTPEVVTSQDVSVEESKEVNISGSQNEGEDDSKETNDVVAQKEVENGSKEVTDCDSQKEDEANAGGESKEVNGSVSHDEIGDESKEVNGGSTHKEVDDTQSTTRRIDVPSSKVGTLIGKGGEMVRYLQVNSGAKIQIRRDAEADPSSALRPVEIIGTVSCIEKAEKLINAVIAEVEAGGVPALAARGVPEQMEIKVPSDKVGVIIGRGGETIKNMQTKSRARIQLIPQNEGDASKERTVRISGDKRQIDIATALIKDVMYQDGRPSPYSGGFNQQAYQPRGPGGPPQWGSRGPHGPHSMPYNYHHGGPYPSQGSHFRPPNSGGYPPQHMPPRSGYGSGWEQRPPHSGPYDYYGRQGGQNPGPVPSHGASYSQAGAQQTYGQMYDQPHYDNPPMHQSYGGYGGSQQGYPSAGGQHQMQQPSRPYGMQGSAEQGYGPPRPAAPPGDVPYQGPTPAAPSYGSTPAAASYGSTPAAPSYGSTPAAPSYGSNMAQQQQYGYASSAPTQQTYPSYSSAAPSDGYNGTQPPAVAPAYEQHGAQPASGVQQTSGGYGQVPPTGGYSSYPSTQPAYGNTPAQSNGNYGYIGSQYPSYGGGNASAYAAPTGQTAYSQTAPPQAGYEQSATQSAGYAAAPGTAQ
ncbi:K Homology domain type 1 superfamily [Arabidopsis suecica]|uniref:K Homology domain type 1 superfamily n=1 Tax=Arabidopsis suecica TaxID=45249 RepID=A0A8T2HC80_ARASU|nr:K Homology domain type 1 superfamily [Arabidopsis suecica]